MRPALHSRSHLHASGALLGRIEFETEAKSPPTGFDPSHIGFPQLQFRNGRGLRVAPLSYDVNGSFAVGSEPPMETEMSRRVADLGRSALSPNGSDSLQKDFENSSLLGEVIRKAVMQP